MEKVSKVLLTIGIVGILLILFFLKYFPTTDLPKLVEKDGYCKIIYGDDFNYNEKSEYCIDYSIDKKFYFTEEEFRNICPKVNFFEKRLYSDCFYKGDSR